MILNESNVDLEPGHHEDDHCPSFKLLGKMTSEKTTAASKSPRDDEDHVTTIVIKIANPSPLGLMCFGMTTLMLMYVNAEWVEPGFVEVVVCYGIFFGGITQLLAGMWEMARGKTLAATAFSSYGAFWLGWSILRVLKLNGFDWGATSDGYATAEALFLGQWGAMSFLFFILSFRSSRTLTFIFLTVTITFFLLCAGEYHHDAKVTGGYIGLIAASAAIYLSIGELFLDIYEIRWPGV